MIDSTASRILALSGCPSISSRPPAFRFVRSSSFRHSPCPLRSLGAGSELVVLVFEQDFERGELSVTARDILLQVELVRIAQFVARVHLLLENSQVIPNHDDFVEECLKRDFFRLKRTVRRLHDQRPALPSSRQTFYEHVLLKGLGHSENGIYAIRSEQRKDGSIEMRSEALRRRGSDTPRSRCECPSR